jgi:quinol monooxygenase YgiN
MILVTCRMVCRPEHVEEFIDAVRTVTAVTPGAEPGCRAYECSRVLDDDTAFVFVEEWDDMAAIGAHVKTAHYAAFDEVAKRALSEQTVVMHTVEKSRTL